MGGEGCRGLRGPGEEDAAGGAAAEAGDGVGVRVLLLDEAEEGVFHEGGAGEGGQAGGERFLCARELREAPRVRQEVSWPDSAVRIARVQGQAVSVRGRHSRSRSGVRLPSRCVRG